MDIPKANTNHLPFKLALFDDPPAFLGMPYLYRWAWLAWIFQLNMGCFWLLFTKGHGDGGCGFSWGNNVQRAIELPAFIGGIWVCPKKLGVHTILDIPMWSVAASDQLMLLGLPWGPGVRDWGLPRAILLKNGHKMYTGVGFWVRPLSKRN